MRPALLHRGPAIRMNAPIRAGSHTFWAPTVNDGHRGSAKSGALQASLVL